MIVKLFAGAREAVGAEQVELTLPSGATVGQARAALCERHPALEAMMRRCVFAVNGDYATDETKIAPSDEVAVIPPVSGG